MIIVNYQDKPVRVKKQSLDFYPDNSRVITNFFAPKKEKALHIINRILSLPDEDIEFILEQTVNNFTHRHGNIKRIFKDYFDRLISKYNISLNDISLIKKLLIGSYFTMEYSIESTALFNPSIVEHYDQRKVNKNSLRVILSFRAVGEGHMSSIIFREGLINAKGDLILTPLSKIVEIGTIIPNSKYNKKNFILQLKEIKGYTIIKDILDNLLDEFTHDELQESIDSFKKKNKKLNELHDKAIETLLWLSNSTYEIQFDKELKLSGRVIFPTSATEIKALEDARFTSFVYEDGTTTYFATYTAYDGTIILPQIIETRDFCNFKLFTLIGSGSRNKGLALFPEKINGKYVMISRNDNENLFIMDSDNIHFWENPKLLKKPEYYWEFYQIGNCGSPLKTKKGWLLLTHGVGPMRIYCIGAILLDLHDPSKVIGRIKEPILFPEESERNGYVPNVVYTCGGIIHGKHLIIPYAMSDSKPGVAQFNLNDILNRMTPIK